MGKRLSTHCEPDASTSDLRLVPVAGLVPVHEPELEPVPVPDPHDGGRAADPVATDRTVMAPVDPGRVQPVAATDQERERNRQEHDADAADQDPHRVVQQLAATAR